MHDAVKVADWCCGDLYNFKAVIQLLFVVDQNLTNCMLTATIKYVVYICVHVIVLAHSIGLELTENKRVVGSSNGRA